MPPQRTMPPAKALKTERTHEENQERAYIAASRRSDRSLEARVESARRASEIHKRRTGRSLRVTEQDVVNEEMYEEEDDDLPIQYRRLTAHLQTQSPDFNRRLAAYLTNHVAMRSALEDSITSSYAQQYPNAPQFAHNHSVFQSPLLQQSPLQSPTSAQHRSSPYPLPGSQSFRGGATGHGRAASIAAPQELSEQTSQAREAKSPSQLEMNRRMSMPVAQTAGQSTPNPSGAFYGNALPQEQRQHNMLQSDFSPFSTALPMESQMFLGSALDPNDPLTSMLMAGSENMPQFNPNSTSTNTSSDKLRNFHPSYDGMSSTLAPSALDMYPNEYSPQSSDGQMTFDAFHTASSKDFKSASGNTSREVSTFGTGSITPGLDGEWSSFIDDATWDQNTT